MVWNIRQPQNKRRTYALAGGGVLLALLGVALWSTRMPASHAAAPSSPALSTKTVRRPLATDLTKAARTKTEERVVRPSYGALLATEDKRENPLTSGMLLEIKADEARRATLVEEKESATDFSYIYRISAHADMEAYVRQLCEASAKRNGMSAVWLRIELDEELRTYLIPVGQERIVRISVPKEPGAHVTYKTGNQHAGTPLSPYRFIQGDSEWCMIPISRNHPTRWRFDHLMELRESE